MLYTSSSFIDGKSQEKYEYRLKKAQHWIEYVFLKTFYSQKILVKVSERNLWKHSRKHFLFIETVIANFSISRQTRFSSQNYLLLEDTLISPLSLEVFSFQPRSRGISYRRKIISIRRDNIVISQTACHSDFHSGCYENINNSRSWNKLKHDITVQWKTQSILNIWKRKIKPK